MQENVVMLNIIYFKNINNYYFYDMKDATTDLVTSFFHYSYYHLLNICVVTGRANITYYERSQSVIQLIIVQLLV